MRKRKGRSAFKLPTGKLARAEQITHSASGMPQVSVNNEDIDILAAGEYMRDICLLQDLSGRRSKVELMIALSEFLKRRDDISDDDFDKMMINDNSGSLQHERLFPNSVEFVREAENRSKTLEWTRGEHRKIVAKRRFIELIKALQKLMVKAGGSVDSIGLDLASQSSWILYGFRPWTPFFRR